MADVPTGFPAGVRVSDHISLGVIAKTFPPDWVRQVLTETGKASPDMADMAQNGIAQAQDERPSIAPAHATADHAHRLQRRYPDRKMNNIFRLVSLVHSGA